ncbi:hypothetical protein [Niallia sp. 03133]|uniref:hypothetical protein n=1 Tax=Niallia sp. 03133 TaxID=3458060 RepID=UPI0040447265
MKRINEKGNALITVLLISLVFTTIGLAVVASSISGTKRVETRESDINITFQSKKVIEEITSEMARTLNSLPIKNYLYERSNHVYIRSSFEQDLKTKVLATSINTVLDKKEYKDFISCMSIVDLSGGTVGSADIVQSAKSCSQDNLTTSSPYSLNKNSDFTKVLEITLVTNNPNKNEGTVTRTLKKRIILSPLPSFLKYAIGSDSSDDKEGLFLNGSPNINGNIYANRLHITDEANYQLKDGTAKQEKSLMPSINGDVYSNQTAVIPVLTNNNFYKKEVPALKNDSQFINIDFDSTFIQRVNSTLQQNGLQTVSSINTIPSNLQTDIGNMEITGITNTNGVIKKVTKQETPLSVIGNTLEKLDESYKIESKDRPIEFNDPIKLKGDVVITSNANASISFNDKLIVDGDLYLVGNDNLTFNNNLFVSGDIHIINFDKAITLYEDIIAAGNIIMESEANQALNSENGIKINGTILAGKSINIRPNNTTIHLLKNVFSVDTFTIKGDESGEEAGENDAISFNSVVYSSDEAFVSNVNIIGEPYIADDGKNKVGQLVLLAKKKLTITRMNEFNNFTHLQEVGSPYLPKEGDKIKPLQAFFYTEEDAELYGVGSLFYIKGGIFAKSSLEINAIRANSDVKNIQNIPRSSEDYLSRFIVDYDQDVLLKGIDALPVVNKLQIIPDEFIIQ